MYCFELFKLSATYSLIALTWLEISSKNLFYVGNIWCENLLLLFILLKKMWLNSWFGTDLCKTPMEFPATIVVSMTYVVCNHNNMVYQLCQCIWDHLHILLLVIIVVHIILEKKIKILHKQGLHPAEILKALKCKGLSESFSSIMHIIRKLCLTASVANLPQSGRLQKLSTEANSVGGNSANKYRQKMPEFTQK